MTTAPDLAAPVVGWRAWVVEADEHGPVLVSPVVPCRWPVREAMTASCRHGCDDAPAWSCTCGVHALADVEAIGVDPAAPVVLGCTALWGRVVECSEGWRGERAYPLLLFAQAHDAGDPAPSFPDAPPALRGRPLDAAVLRALGRRYAVPLHRLPGDLAPGLVRSANGRSLARMRRTAPARFRYLPGYRVLSEAEEVRDEAGRGLAARRLGDGDARRRLDVAVDHLLAALRVADPPTVPPTDPPPITA